MQVVHDLRSEADRYKGPVVEENYTIYCEEGVPVLEVVLDFSALLRSCLVAVFAITFHCRTTSSSPGLNGDWRLIRERKLLPKGTS
jgi:hypothetical protein